MGAIWLVLAKANCQEAMLLLVLGLVSWLVGKNGTGKSVFVFGTPSNGKWLGMMGLADGESPINSKANPKHPTN